LKAYDPQIVASEWTSLEIVKVAVAAATPIAVVLLGLYVRKVTQRLEDAQWSKRRVIERRVELYNRMGPLFNDLYCCVMKRGDFRKITPPVAVKRKRELDRQFHINRYLFSEQFATAYESFISTYFIENEHVGSVARLRVDRTTQKSERAPSWDDQWDALILRPHEKPPTPKEFTDAYDRLMTTFADEASGRSDTHQSGKKSL
jgi:hypothetical protein